MTSPKNAKFDEITQSSMLISLFSGVDPKTKYFENVPVIMGGEGLITDHQARLKVEEAFGQLNLPDLFETFDFMLYRSSYEPFKLKEDLVIAPYIYTVKAKHQDTFVMSLFLTPWADVNLSQFQEKIIDLTVDFSGIFRRTTEEIHTEGKEFLHRTKECEQGGTMLMDYLSHLVFDQRQMLGGTEKVSKPTNLLAVLFQRGKIGKYYACGECGTSFSSKTAQDLEKCPNCGGFVSKAPIHLFNPLYVSVAYPEGLIKAEAGINSTTNLHKPIDFLYLFQSSYLPNEIRVTLNRIAEHIFTWIVPLPHRALFEYRDTDDILTLYSLSKLEGDEILVISGIADSRPQVEGQLSQMALRLFIRDLNEGVKKGYTREEIFSKSILKDWQLSSWIPLKGEFTPEPLTSWTNLKNLATNEE
jgi:rubrerythrin